jgi:hypothetical protein
MRILLLLLMSTAAFANPICSPTNKDFAGYFNYPADTGTYSKCTRNVTSATKAKVYKQYGIVDHSNYCIDHGVSLFAGGSNEIDNLWPNLKDGNGQCEKQGLETEIYASLKKGIITTPQAQKRLYEYVEMRKRELYGR